MRPCLRSLLIIALAAASLPCRGATSPTLHDQFLTPPPETRPWTFWYWINGHVSRAGITRDLESMKEFGIGTAFIGNDYFEEMPKGPVQVLSDEWWDLVVHAVREARRLGIDVGVFNCAGWSQSGGPWVTPAQTMRSLAWSETPLSGGIRFSGVLPAPRLPFQNIT